MVLNDPEAKSLPLQFTNEFFPPLSPFCPAASGHQTEDIAISLLRLLSAQRARDQNFSVFYPLF